MISRDAWSYDKTTKMCEELLYLYGYLALSGVVIKMRDMEGLLGG